MMISDLITTKFSLFLYSALHRSTHASYNICFYAHNKAYTLDILL